MTWFAFQVKDFYDRPSQYAELRRCLIGTHGVSNADIYIPGGGDYANPMARYVFIRLPDKDAMPRLWPALSKEKYLKASEGFLEIPDAEMDNMVAGLANRPKDAVCYGDVIKAESTECRDLYGVVLDERPDGGYAVGFNLFSGPRVAMLRRDDFIKVQSLFAIWKFPAVATTR